MNEQPQAQVKQTPSKPILKYLLILGGNLAVLLSIFLIQVLKKKSAFVKPFFIWTIAFFVIEFIFYICYFFLSRYNSQPKKKAGVSNTLEQIEQIAEDYMWKKEGIRSRQVLTMISEPRAIEVAGTTVQAFVWYFRDRVSVFKPEYLFACLVENPEIRGFRRIEKRPDEQFIADYVKSIAKQPVDMRIMRNKRVDATGNIVTEESYEPVYQAQQQVKEEGKL